MIQAVYVYVLATALRSFSASHASRYVPCYTGCMPLHSILVIAQWAVDVWLGCGSACDIIIAATMCYLLHTSRTGVKRCGNSVGKTNVTLIFM